MLLIHHTSTALNTHMPIPERVLKPKSVYEEDVRKWKEDNSEFQPAWRRHIDSHREHYTSVLYSIIIHALAIVGVIYLLS